MSKQQSEQSDERFLNFVEIEGEVVTPPSAEPRITKNSNARVTNISLRTSSNNRRKNPVLHMVAWHDVAESVCAAGIEAGDYVVVRGELRTKSIVVGDKTETVPVIYINEIDKF